VGYRGRGGTGAAGARQIDAERARVQLHQARAVQRHGLLARRRARLGVPQQPPQAALLNRRRRRRAASAREHRGAGRRVEAALGGALPRARAAACGAQIE